jgi:hypothetical protein
VKKHLEHTGLDGAETAARSSGRTASDRLLLLHHRTHDREDGLTGEIGAAVLDLSLTEINSSPLILPNSRSSIKVGETGRDETCGSFVRAASRHNTSASIRGEPSLRVIYLVKSSQLAMYI